MTLTLYNTLTRRKEPFRPIDAKNVRMYVCGPTVYDYAHIGNARPVIVFDLLFRLLRHVYRSEHVTYVRNITDVEDKINARAAELYPHMPSEAAIKKLTEETAAQFHADIASLGVLPPTVEPRATEYIRRSDNKLDMVGLIETLVRRRHAYVEQDHVLFDVSSMPDYGQLANRSLKDMEAGARVEVAPYKKGPMDFVLWKPSKRGEPAWPSPAGIKKLGRPGWHIECSAMAGALLGEVFDIHGGGIDLVFPHHENEIAQSRCAHGMPVMANVWMHNGFLQVQGEKMSKSLGNFVTINELLKTDKFGGRRWPGEVIRVAMLMTQYRQPIDWTVSLLEQSEKRLMRWKAFASEKTTQEIDRAAFAKFVTTLQDDLNTPEAFSLIDAACAERRANEIDRSTVYKMLSYVGIAVKRSPVTKAIEDLGGTLNKIALFTSSDWNDVVHKVESDNSHIEHPAADLKLLASMRAASDIKKLLRKAFPDEVTWNELVDASEIQSNSQLSIFLFDQDNWPQSFSGGYFKKHKEARERVQMEVLARKLESALASLAKLTINDWRNLALRARTRHPRGSVTTEVILFRYFAVLSAIYERIRRNLGRDIHSPRLSIIAARKLDQVAAGRHLFEDQVDHIVEARNAARKAKDFKESDRIRDELSAMGIQLKDAKDPATGEIVTTWEVKR